MKRDASSSADAVSTRMRRGAAFTLTELLIVVAVFTILAALILSSVGKAKSAAMRARCAGNLRQIGQALVLYAGDNENQVPPGQNQTSEHGISSQPFSSGFGCLTGKYIPAARSARGSSVWRCPAQTDATYLDEAPWAWSPTNDIPRWHGTYSYALRTRNKITGLIEDPSLGSWGAGPWPSLKITDGNFVYAFDHCYSPSTTAGRFTCHQTGYNCVFYDGHVEYFIGKEAGYVDYIAGFFAAMPYRANYTAGWYVFDRSQGLYY